MFLTMFFKTQNIVQTMHLTMLIAHPYPSPQSKIPLLKALAMGASARGSSPRNTLYFLGLNVFVT